MAADRKHSTIGALIAEAGGSIRTGPFGTILKANEYTSSGVPLISVGEIGYGTFHIHEKTPRVSPVVTERLPGYVLREGDIVFGRKGAVDRSARISADQAGWFLGSDGIRLRLPETTDSRFIAYQLQSEQSRRWLLQHATGTTMASLNQGVIERVPIVLPPLPEQRAIAHILGTFDAKIELNRRMNETLEAMARVLFKSWFVDFDPVRAKVEGRAPSGMDTDTAKLFPNEFVGSELGPIPKGWTLAPLEGWATALSGGTPSKGNAGLWGGDLPWISPKVMTSIHADDADAFVTPKAVGNGTRIAPALSTLVMVRGMGLHQEVRVSQARNDVTFNQDVKALVPKAIESSLLLFALLDAQEELLGRVETSGHGTGKLPSEILLKHPIVMPGASVQQQLATFFDALNDRIALGCNETRTLATLRDELLPRLLTGELSVAALAEPMKVGT